MEAPLPPSKAEAEASTSTKRPSEIEDDAEAAGERKRVKMGQDVPAPASASEKGKGKGKNKWKEGKGPKSRRKLESHAEGGGYGTKRNVAPENGEPKAPRLPKRMCALLIGFCGSGYSGMQIQQGTRTIENTLFDALVRVGAVSKDNADDPTKVSLGRAARTDAGVHAAGNVVALKMITQIPGVEDLTARINEELPPEIRLWQHVRSRPKLLQSAHVGYILSPSATWRLKTQYNDSLCDSRKYTYFFPSYLLIPPKPTSPLYRVLVKHAASFSPPMESPITGNAFWGHVQPVADEQVEGEVDPPSTEEDKADMSRKRAWRIGPEPLAALRAGAQRYVGTHNFHNFTINAAFSDRSNQRFMPAIEIADPVVYGETEWISVLFHGQSFMMHQIRKMISALVLTARTGTPPQVLDELYGPRNVFIPKMPALGLLLEQPIFDSYNIRVKSANEKLQNGEADPDYRPAIEFAVHQDRMEAFKEEWIYRNMRMVEERDALFDAWIRMVDAYAGTDLLYLNPRGVIPATAVIQLPPTPAEGKNKGNKERFRKGGFRERKLFDATSFPVPGQMSGDGAGVVGEQDGAKPREEEDSEEDEDERALREAKGRRDELDG
ncbi:PseudoU-synth-1 domain-containing protein [Mycena chlorophos]|uniref:tRNA pseudouridine synthase 1 n=1 Tax=Mycena chlorophos TaxID=658473 RepID=A0A8H6SZG7_MYCCL|nr:PseudoU-synth-1 domain-containing protein [Mycena chlorophos]